MITISSSDIIKNPSYIMKPEDIIFVKDAKGHAIRSVVLPYSLYEKVQEKIEDELYLFKNAKALSKEAYDDFLEIETVVESDENEAR